MTRLESSGAFIMPQTTASASSGHVYVGPSASSIKCLLSSAAMASTPPPLMKKHSQTDLVSRLKSRKVLGVGGEDDDGEVHRSKISQMLGNEMKFAVREPTGLRIWLLISAVLFTSTSLMALAFPNQLYELIFELTTTRISIRLYGGALLCISLILWNGLYTAEKVIIQWTLLTEACYFGVQFLEVHRGPQVDNVSLVENTTAVKGEIVHGGETVSSSRSTTPVFSLALDSLTLEQTRS
ncbi:Tumor protein p53-inducible protein 11 [Anabarilius grahami]|uniref:Tumor protein p53-inducible protein 11 n=1 Tax=Anabarilius grahami TaxID=495550 RepID=A0A3N0XSY5_ANAGA|nr:Tumor protein p53-inducible protein 11 [Anabarilius grahami]